MNFATYYIIKGKSKEDDKYRELYRCFITTNTDFRNVFELYTQYLWSCIDEFSKIDLWVEYEDGACFLDYSTVLFYPHKR